MQTFDQSLWDLFQAGLINYETALESAQRRRLQAAYAGHFFHQRYFQKRDATDRLRWPLIYPPETLEGALKRALSYFGGGRNLTSTVKPTAEPTRSSGPVKSSCS